MTKTKTTAAGSARKRLGKGGGGSPPGKAATRRSGPMLLMATLVVLAAAYAGALVFLRPPAPGAALSLDQVARLAESKSVKAVRFLDQDARIVGTQVAEGGRREFWASYPKSDAATNDLIKSFFKNGVEVRVDPQTPKAVVRFLAQFLLPLVILANLFALLFFVSQRGSSGASEFLVFGRVGDKRVGNKQRSATTFADVAGAEEMVVELAEVRDYLADPTEFTAMGALPPKGVLLMGPPGCGKTLLARAVAGEADATFYSMSGSEFVETLVGVGASRVRDLFRQARAAAPSLIFIDELDAVARHRGAGMGQGHDEREQTLNELLVQMDGFSPQEGVVVVAATNRPDILDPALLRPGRFDRHITVERPDVEGRTAILRLHAASKRLASPEADLAAIARHTPGFSGADLAGVLNEAALLAVRERAGSIRKDHLDEAIERVLSGPRRRTQVISAEDKRRLAVHEAGHAVVAAALGKAALIQKVSIIARGRGIGHLAVLEDKALLTDADMEAQIAIAVAGLAAEELVLGRRSTGSEADLERATHTARDMAGRYGMSPRLGLVRVLQGNREVFLGRDYTQTREVSQPTMEHLDAEIRRILDEQHASAATVLGAERAALDAVASALVDHETLQGVDLQAVLARVAPWEHTVKAAKPARPRAARAEANGSATPAKRR